MAKYTCKKQFDVCVQKIDGVTTKVCAEVGDIVEVNVRNRDYFYIIAIYKQNPSKKIKVFSTWMRQNWIKSNCN